VTIALSFVDEEQEKQALATGEAVESLLLEEWDATPGIGELVLLNEQVYRVEYVLLSNRGTMAVIGIRSFPSPHLVAK